MWSARPGSPNSFALIYEVRQLVVKSSFYRDFLNIGGYAIHEARFRRSH